MVETNRTSAPYSYNPTENSGVPITFRPQINPPAPYGMAQNAAQRLHHFNAGEASYLAQRAWGPQHQSGLHGLPDNHFGLPPLQPNNQFGQHSWTPRPPQAMPGNPPPPDSYVFLANPPPLPPSSAGEAGMRHYLAWFVERDLEGERPVRSMTLEDEHQFRVQRMDLALQSWRAKLQASRVPAGWPVTSPPASSGFGDQTALQRHLAPFVERDLEERRRTHPMSPLEEQNFRIQRMAEAMQASAAQAQYGRASAVQGVGIAYPPGSFEAIEQQQMTDAAAANYGFRPR